MAQLKWMILKAPRPEETAKNSSTLRGWVATKCDNGVLRGLISEQIRSRDISRMILADPDGEFVNSVRKKGIRITELTEVQSNGIELLRFLINRPEMRSIPAEAFPDGLLKRCRVLLKSLME